MVKILAGFILLISFNCYSQEYFEGELNYKIEYETINKDISVEVIEKEFGRSFTAYVKEDRYTMLYHSKGKQGWMKVIVRLDQGYEYLEFEKSDTIVKTKFDNENKELIKFERNKNDSKEVLGTLCESITLNYKVEDNTSFFQEYRGKYYFDPKYKLNSKLYSNYNSGFWNLYVEESEAISLRNEIEFYPLFKSIQEVTSIEEKEIDNSIFEPNSNKIIVLSD